MTCPRSVAGVLHPRVAGIAQIDRVRVVDQEREWRNGLVALRALPSWIGLCLVTDVSCRRRCPGAGVAQGFSGSLRRDLTAACGHGSSRRVLSIRASGSGSFRTSRSSCPNGNHGTARTGAWSDASGGGSGALVHIFFAMGNERIPENPAARPWDRAGGAGLATGNQLLFAKEGRRLCIIDAEAGTRS